MGKPADRPKVEYQLKTFVVKTGTQFDNLVRITHNYPSYFILSIVASYDLRVYRTEIYDYASLRLNAEAKRSH